MKYTLLDLVQTVLASIDGDEVNSIGDTTEAHQVAILARTAYYDIVSPADLSEHYGFINLEATTEDTPVILTRPTTIDYIDKFEYNARTDGDTEDLWKEVVYLEPQEFMALTRKFDQSATNVSSIAFTANDFTTKLYFQTDKYPEYWTSFDDNYVICDSYDSSVDDCLQKSKTYCTGKLLKEFPLEDDFTPELDDQQFSLLLNETKALAWAELKQSVNQRAERNVRQAKIKLERNKKDLPGKDGWKASLPNYGRHR